VLALLRLVVAALIGVAAELIAGYRHGASATPDGRLAMIG
jgi:hypothetical protein